MWLLLFVIAAVLAAPPVHSGDRPVRITTWEQAEGSDDPRALYRAAESVLAGGDAALAEKMVERAVQKEELTQYLRYRQEVGRALVLERLGRLDEAAELYRQGISNDVQGTILALQIASVHPDREALVQEGVAHVQELVRRARAGEKAVIYVQDSGKERALEVIEPQDLVKALEANEGLLKYCYVEEVDLREETVSRLPDTIGFSRCILGRVLLPDREVHAFNLRAIVLGDVDLGKTWSGEVNKSRSIPGSRFAELMIRESVFLGRVNLQDVSVSGRNAYFVLSSFAGDADFRDTDFQGVADFRFSVFGQGANFKGSHMSDAVYFGGSRYLKPTTFRGMYSEQDVFFNSTTFEDAASFDKCEWARGASFENSTFRGPVSFNSSQLGGRLNMSRTVFASTLTVKEMQLGGMDFIGSWLQGDTAFVDVRFGGKVRFSLDDVTRAQYLQDPTPLLSLYRDYQGDKDAEAPLTTRSSYGVEHVDDLIARVDGDLSFANSVFEGFCIFERVQFGLPPDDPRHRATQAVFYNTQFGGETHFERTTWYSNADFTTIFADELSLNEAEFHGSLVLDDANVSGRATLTDAAFHEGADLSFYGAEIAAFQIDRAQVEAPNGTLRLFYQECATADPVPREDIRIARLTRDKAFGDEDLRAACYDRVADEFVALKQSFGDRAMTTDEDWAYWWIRHSELVRDFRHGGFGGLAYALVAWPVFEVGFGWGVRLGNLGITAVFITFLFAGIYRRFCPDTVVNYNGGEVPVRDIPWHGLVYISMQSLGAFNTGWDFGEDDARFRYLNSLETFLGIIILTFFVGAYTRMILA